MKRIWGIQYEEILSDDYLLWRLKIRKPFFNKGKWWIGLNEKFLLMARKSGVKKFIIETEGREIMFDVPNEKFLKEKIEKGEFQEIPSKFQNSPPMRIYHFQIPKVSKSQGFEKMSNAKRFKEYQIQKIHKDSTC